MKVLLLIAGLIALAEASSLERPGATWRIIDGEDAKPGEIPFQVSLQTPFELHFCGGSVLNKKFVITAAHCVDGIKPRNVIVIAGTVDLKEPKLRKTIEKIIVHEEYDPQYYWRNDIALLKLQDEFVVTAELDFVELPNPHELIPAGSVATVSGWGQTRASSLFIPWLDTTVLQKAQIQIVDQELCRNAYNPDPIHDTQICAHHPNKKRGVCNGDSGGPLMVNNKLVGIVSWAKACASPTYPTVYTRVSEYLEWIDSNVY